jgi:hypothetical protein
MPTLASMGPFESPDDPSAVTSARPPQRPPVGGQNHFVTFMNSGPVGDNAWQVLVANRHTTAFTAPMFVRAIWVVVED